MKGKLRSKPQQILDTVRRYSFTLATTGLATTLLYGGSTSGVKQALLDCCSKHPVVLGE